MCISADTRVDPCRDPTPVPAVGILTGCIFGRLQWLMALYNSEHLCYIYVQPGYAPANVESYV
jgi:hypothetical protein